MRIDANYMTNTYAMSAYSGVIGDEAVDFALELGDEPADDVVSAEDGLQPGESRDYDGILESQLTMGQHKRDMFLTVNAADEISEQVFGDHQRDITRNQVDLHWAYL